MSFYRSHAPDHREHNRPLPDLAEFEGMKSQAAEGKLPSAKWAADNDRIKELGLEPADSIEDKTEISCFQRGSTPHWSGINTFLKLPYLEDVRKVGEYDVAFVGVPFDIGCTFRSGTRFGPQGMRRISALYQKYSYEHAIDLSETLKMCDVGDIFCPANITKGHDQITKGVAHILSQGTLPMIMGGDHSIGYPDGPRRGPVRGRQRRDHPPRPARGHAGKGHGRDHAHLSVVPRHEHQELPAEEPGAAGDRRLAGAACRREGGAGARHDDPDRQRHREDRDREDHRDRAGGRLEGGAAPSSCRSTSTCVDAGFVPGTGWPEPGGFLPREVAQDLEGIAKEGIAAMEVVEVSPPYDISDITSLMGVRSMVDVIASDGQERPDRRDASRSDQCSGRGGTGLHPRDRSSAGDAAWATAEAQAASLQAFAGRTFGVTAAVDLACLPGTTPGEENRRADHRPGDRRKARPQVFVLPAALRPEYLAADDAGRGAERGASPAPRRLHPSRYRRSHAPAARRLFRRSSPRGAGRAGHGAAAGRSSSSSPTDRATPPPAPTPTA